MTTIFYILAMAIVLLICILLSSVLVVGFFSYVVNPIFSVLLRVLNRKA